MTCLIDAIGAVKIFVYIYGMKLRTALVFFLLFTAPYAAHAQTFGAQEFTLENGLQVVVIPNHRAPIVTTMLWMKVGRADEAPGVSGMAHYLEHLMFKGTKKMAPGDFSKTVKTLGGDDNAFTSQDYTAYFSSVSVDNLPKIMEMDADRLMNLNPPAEHFASEKNVVLEERRQRTDNDPRALFGEQLGSLLFVNHPYGTPTIGWMAEIESYEWADVKKFYDAWYAPNNAILVVSGDITAEKLKPLAEKYYGVLPKKELPSRKRPAVPPAPAPVELTMENPAIRQSIYQKTYIAPSENMNREDSLSIQVLSEIMGGTANARFYKNIVVEQKKATGISFNYQEAALDYGTISLYGTPAQGVSTQELGKAIDDEIKKVITDGVTETEVKEAIQRLQDQAVFARDSVAGPAIIFGAALTTGSTVEDVEHWADDISKVSAADVQNVATKYLNDLKPWIRPAVTGHLLPAAQTTAPVEDANVQR